MFYSSVLCSMIIATNHVGYLKNFNWCERNIHQLPPSCARNRDQTWNLGMGPNQESNPQTSWCVGWRSNLENLAFLKTLFLWDYKFHISSGMSEKSVIMLWGCISYRQHSILRSSLLSSSNVCILKTKTKKLRSVA